MPASRRSTARSNISPGEWACRPSLVPQRFDGIEPRGLPGGIEPKTTPTVTETPRRRGSPAARRAWASAGASRTRNEARRGRAAMPHAAAEQAQHHGLDQELPQDDRGAAPTAMRRPISRVRSVTETSMMFMMPTPPTTSEISATTSSSVAHQAATWTTWRLGDLGHVADVEVVGLAGRGCGAARAAAR